MSNKRAPLRLDEDHNVTLTLVVPASLHRSLHLYCVYRGHDARKIPKAATAAIAEYLATDGAFKAWRREHPQVVAQVPDATTPPASAARASRSPRSRAGTAVPDAPRQP
jgi:hypothetical protein